MEKESQCSTIECRLSKCSACPTLCEGSRSSFPQSNLADAYARRDGIGELYTIQCYVPVWLALVSKLRQCLAGIDNVVVAFHDEKGHERTNFYVLMAHTRKHHSYAMI